MAARAELLALIRHAKDDLDDVPRRLVLADWLEEHGDEADQRRASALRGLPWGRDHRSWFGRLYELGHVSLEPNGFTAWRVPGRTLLAADAAALGEPFAWVGSLTVNSISGAAVARLVEGGLLAEVPSLNIRGPAIRTEGAVHLSRLPDTVLLRHLNLGHHQIEHAGVKRLARAKFASRLWSLDLSGSRLWPDSLKELAAAGFAELRDVVIGSPNLNDAAAHLVGAAWLPSLRGLSLSKCALWDGGTARLLREGDLRSLVALDLSDNSLGRGFVAALVDSPALPALKELNLSDNPQLADAIPALAEWPGLRRLRKLGLSSVYLNRAGYDALAQSPHLDQLEQLDLRGSLPFAAAAQPLRERFGDRLLV
jgi:uncharacterized protein (TIGR02996 family)